MTEGAPALVIGWDTETHLIAEGQIVPRLVCATFDIADEGKVSPTANIRDTFRAWVTSNAHVGPNGLLEQLLAMFQECYRRRAHVVIQAASFDLTVGMRYCLDVIEGSQEGDAKRARELYQLIWEVLDQNLDSELEGRGVFLHDTAMRQRLYNLSTIGLVDFQMKGRDVGYSLSEMVSTCFDIDISGAKVSMGANGRVLDAQGNDITGTPAAAAAWRLRFSELDGVHESQWPPEAAQYAIDDASWARKVWEWQEARRQPRLHGSMNSESLQIYADTALRLYTIEGFRIDREQVAKVTKHIAAELEKSEAILKMNGIVRPNNTVNTAVLHDRIKAAWAAKGLNPWLTEKGGNISASAEVLEELAGIDPILDLYEARTGIIKIQTSFLPNLQGGRVWSNYDILKETGRCSSYGNSDKSKRAPLYAAVNIQQIPKAEGVRECFLPPPPDATAPAGYVMLSVDYGALELCSTAQVTYTLLGWSVHREKINLGYDLHTFLGSGMAMSLEPYVVDNEVVHDNAYKALQRHRKAKVHEADPSPEAATARQLKDKATNWRNLAKPVGLGYPGGLGPATLVTLAKTTYGVRMDQEQATVFRELWRQTYPEMPLFFKWVNGQTDQTFPGQDLYCYETQGYNRFRAACTYCATANGKAMQSLSADGAKRSVCWLARAMMKGIPSDSPYALLGDCIPLAFIHDENLAAVPFDLLTTERCLLVCKLQIEAMKVSMPDVLITAEPAIMRRWIKKAEPEWVDAPGRSAQVYAALNQWGEAHGVQGYADIVAKALGPSYNPDKQLVPWDDAHKAKSA